MSAAAPRQPPVLALVGPTAVGKTALSLAVATALNAEIISVDSRQVYRGLDIGTAKATAAERASVRHHLLDVVTPDEAYSVALYQRQARTVIARLHAHGKLPLLVGGTGLYFRAVCDGLVLPPVPPQPELRAEWEARVAAGDLAGLVAELRRLDPVGAAAARPRQPPPRHPRAGGDARQRAPVFRLATAPATVLPHHLARPDAAPCRAIRPHQRASIRANRRRPCGRGAWPRPAGLWLRPAGHAEPRVPRNRPVSPRAANPRRGDSQPSSKPPAATPAASSPGFAATSASPGSPHRYHRPARVPGRRTETAAIAAASAEVVPGATRRFC